MSSIEQLRSLLGEIQELEIRLRQIEALYLSYRATFQNEEQRDLRDAVLLADILCNTYTGVETGLVRITRTFENHLDPEHWHRELLHKMKVEVPGIRPTVLSQSTHHYLDELRRFRHFKRYYFEFDYDWERLDYMAKVLEKVFPKVLQDWKIFQEYIGECLGKLES